ncbi:MAG: hypothetical protein H7321_06140, partial [Bacteroidia bacterium]|nr:hypothetical protein [Bacteroidia bacterium]
MKQLSRIFKIIGILMVGLLLLVGGVLYFLSDKLEAFAISEINKKLTVQVKVKSHNVTWFETFPNISIRFSGVEIPESTPLANKPFLEAQKVYLSFNIIDVLRGKYKISKISIADATARIYIKNDSTNNYSVFRKTGKNSSSSSLDLKKILLENSRVDFMDFSSSIHTDILADELEASGNFQEEKFVVTAAGNGKINRMKIGESDWLEEKYFDIEGGIDVNTSINSYTFDNTALKLGDASFIFAGNIQKPEKDWITNLTVEGKEADLSTLLAVLPGKYAGKVREYSSEGQFYFKGKIKGKASATLTPFIDFSFGIKNGTIKNSSFGGNLSQVNLTASLNNKNNIFSLSVDPFNVVLNKQRITGSLLLRDFNNLYIDAHIKGNPDLKDLEAFIGVEGLKLQGQSNIDLSFAGYVNDFKSTATLLNTRFSGSVSLINVKVERESNPFVFSGVNGAFNFNNLEISTPGLKGNIGSNA